MIKINVLDEIGPICVDPDDGERLCDHVRRALAEGDRVTLDFSGVTTLTSSFLNSALGCLLGTFPEDELARRLSWTGLDETDEDLVKLVVKNAVRFYSASADHQTVMVAASRRAFEE